MPMQEKISPKSQVITPANGNTHPNRVTNERIKPVSPIAFDEAARSGCGAR